MSIVRRTKSLCPVCRKNVPAVLEEQNGKIYIKKSCDEHGDFSCLVWNGKECFECWVGNAPRLLGGEGELCPSNCGICSSHLSGSCCVLLEVSRRCNLNCSFCFAHEGREREDPPFEDLCRAVSEIYMHGKPLLQLSGGEPTLRDDLPELIGYAKKLGYSFVQLNSNGLRLAEDKAYVRALAENGLSFVFLQFDGTDDEVFKKLRGRSLLEIKERAIENCGSFGIGVTLVPTVVKGVNDDQIARIIEWGVSRSPVVRGVHFQPVSYFGKIPVEPSDGQRYTLDELIYALKNDAKLPPRSIRPSSCDHPLCGLHAAYYVEEGKLIPSVAHETCCCSDARQNRNYIGTRWASMNIGSDGAEGSLDEFLKREGRNAFTVTAMAFQDINNIDIERLKHCSLHVYSDGVLKPFCANYI